jgi:hypothetical protein
MAGLFPLQNDFIDCGLVYHNRALESLWILENSVLVEVNADQAIVLCKIVCKKGCVKKIIASFLRFGQNGREVKSDQLT